MSRRVSSAVCSVAPERGGMCCWLVCIVGKLHYFNLNITELLFGRFHFNLSLPLAWLSCSLAHWTVLKFSIHTVLVLVHLQTPFSAQQKVSSIYLPQVDAVTSPQLNLCRRGFCQLHLQFNSACPWLLLSNWCSKNCLSDYGHCSHASILLSGCLIKRCTKHTSKWWQLPPFRSLE